MKNINVVAHKSLRKQAISLAHSISKLDDVKAAYWTPNQLKDNEARLTGKQALILIGSTPESDPYIDLIKVKSSKHGVSWGFDGTKAAIAIDTDKVDSKALLKDLKKHVDIAKETEKAESSRRSGDSILPATTIGIMTSAALLPTFALAFNIFAIPMLLITWIIKIMSKKKELRKTQYAYGLLVFSQNKLDDFLNQLT